MHTERQSPNLIFGMRPRTITASMIITLALTVLLIQPVQAQTPATGGWTEQVLHNFNEDSLGCVPYDGLIFDAAGNAYSTTSLCGAYGEGTVFELTPTAVNWTMKVLHSFGHNSDGAQPFASPIFNAAGKLYGTTVLGGSYGGGAVYELMRSPNATGGGWSEQVLHSFNNDCSDGCYVTGGVILDTAGNLYGTTVYGGSYGYGTVFELTPTTGGGWTEQVLHSFNLNGMDGVYPFAGLIFDGAGNLYGTTNDGGSYGYGTVFELTPTTGGGWTEQVLHSFTLTGMDGGYPYAGLIFDTAGNLYGTTTGTSGNAGTVFELTPTAGGGWTEQVLYTFCSQNGCTDGGDPFAGLIFDAAGNLYGTTKYGGTYGGGTAFELTPTAGGNWTEQVLHSFGNGTDGFWPYSGSLIFDPAGNLYGTTDAGGTYTWGTVFEIVHH